MHRKPFQFSAGFLGYFTFITLYYSIALYLIRGIDLYAGLVCLSLPVLILLIALPVLYHFKLV